MKTLEETVTAENANDGIPGEADSCAIAIALKETHFPEDKIHVEVGAEGVISVLMEGLIEDDTGVVPREKLYDLYPSNESIGNEIQSFIEDYDGTGCVDDWDKVEYMKFPYHFKWTK